MANYDAMGKVDEHALRQMDAWNKVAELLIVFFFSSRRRHTRWPRDWSSDVCSSDLVPGEIRTRHEFYDYEAKYVDEDTELLVPAALDEEQTREVQRLAIRAGEVLDCEGLGRVDFLMERSSGAFLVNEVNSLPGFTESSMFPQLWEASGLPYPALLD